MMIPRGYQIRLDRARQRRTILALGFREIDMHRPIAGATIHSTYADVYFARLRDGTIKIGSSRDPQKRARQLQAQLLAVIPGVGPAFEAFMHHYFEGFRIPGRGERFEPEAPIWRFIGHVHRALEGEAVA